ncbi:hypothetical protein BVRB_023940 [Beta vulgaris subsp. vulgaris]|uniref:Uncharacterized protein n=1 Tax=Beta vulgaris subsp. vulgaris TaxID=3555 RepID=A0A0J8AZP2_BETVV|nr:hypothetical protein BVRB_023940 [Beta vulgaris subsp. vulgaris]
MVRYQDLFYPGKVALPLIVSYLAFGRPLTPEALSKFHITTQICLSDSQCSAAASSDAAKSSFLYRWFGQDGSGTVKATSLAQSKTGWAFLMILVRNPVKFFLTLHQQSIQTLQKSGQ